MSRRLRGLQWVGVVTLVALVALTAGCSDKKAPNAASGGAGSKVVQTGELQPASAATKPSGWDTDAGKLVGVRLLAQLDSSGPDAWNASQHPLVYVTAQGPGYGGVLAATDDEHEPANPDGAPGIAIIDANSHQPVASVFYQSKVKAYAENHGAAVSADGKWIYTQGNHESSKASGNATLSIINARTMKIDKIIETRVHHIAVIHSDKLKKDLVLIQGWGTFFALDPADDNKVVAAVNPAELNGAGYLAFADPTGKWLLISVRTGFGSAGGVAVVSLDDWKIKARINTEDASPIFVAFTADSKIAYVSGGHDSKISRIDMSKENPVDWKVNGVMRAGTEGPYGITLSWDEKTVYAIGKGEGSHNLGKTVGFSSTSTFVEPPGFGRPTGEIVTNCLREDHAILHPDPAKNEMWISCNSSFDNVIVDMASQKVKAVVAQPGGGSSHNGSFVKYGADWKGELLSDTNGLHGSAVAAQKTVLQKAAAAR
jgi:hypothetical protein